MSKTTRLALLTVCLVIALTCVFVACSSTKYTLTYDTVGGQLEGESSVMFKEGGKVTPPTPSKGNFVFDGWYADAGYTTKFESFDDMPAGDLTVYAKWQSYTSGKIHFDSNGGSDVDSLRGITGQAVTAPQNPTKTGYKFAGWCEDQALTRLYAFSTYPNGEITLYAKWQQDTAQFAYVTFDINGATTEVAVQKGQPVEQPVAPQGQTCVWYNSASKNVVYNFESAIIGNTTLYGVLCTEGLVVKGNTVTEYNGTESQVFIPQTNGSVYVTTIAPGVFEGNNVVTTVHLPQTLQTISDYAFYNCQYLEDINLSSTVKTIGKFAFAGCKRLTANLDLTGLAVVQQNTFANCKAVTQVTFADNLVSIADFAFTDCKSLTEINLPSNVESIGEYAFSNTAITTLNLPAALTTLGQGAVKGCEIASITAQPEANFEVVGNTVYTKDGKTLLLQFGTVDTLVVPATVETINAWAFSSATVANLDVSAVAETALYKGSLGAIEGLQSLKVAKFSTDNEFLAYWFGASSAIENTTNSLYVPQTLTQVQFTTAQTVVPAYAFYGCNSLQSVVGFESATEIGAYAYAYTRINNIELNKQLTKLDGTAFAGANELVLTLDEQNENFAMYEGAVYTKDLSKLLLVPSSKTEITFAPQMTVIGEDAFANSLIKEIVVPNTVEEICFGAFEGVAALEKLTVPFIGGGKADNQYMLHVFGAQVQYDPNTLSAGITGDTYPMTLKQITLSNPVTVIPDVAFLYCKGLETLVNDAEVTSIGNYAFLNAGFVEVEIPDTVTTIGVMAYAQSTKIEKVVIGAGVTEIKQQAFALLESLQSVEFKEGENDLVIGDEAFLGRFEEGNRGYVGRSYLGEIKLSNNVVSIGAMAFGFAGTYGEDPQNFSKFELKFDVANSRLKTIGEMAFGYSAVKTLTLPASIETIGPVAFFNCQMLLTVRIGSAAHQASKLVLIDDGAFAGCIGLSYVYLYKVVTDVSQVPVLGLKVNEETKNINVFYNTLDTTVYVPKSSIAFYKQAWASEEYIKLKELGGM